MYFINFNTLCDFWKTQMIKNAYTFLVIHFCRDKVAHTIFIDISPSLSF